MQRKASCRGQISIQRPKHLIASLRPPRHPRRRHAEGAPATEASHHTTATDCVKIVRMKKYGYVYIMTNKSNSVVYTGITSSLARRVYEHKNGLCEGFTKKYNITKLVYFECYGLVTDAIAREKYIKGKSRKFKYALVSSKNPNWDDWSTEIDY
jgi:putative endonuclease